MSIVDIAARMITASRVRGEVPAYVAVSNDVYTSWQQENCGVEPTVVLDLPIRIRDHFEPATMLIFVAKAQEPAEIAVTMDTVMSKIALGEYGPDAEASTLLRLTSRAEGMSGHDGGKAMQEYCFSIERARAQLAKDALQAMKLESHPRACEIFRFAEKMAGDDWDAMKILSILRRIGEFVHSKTLE